MQVLHAAGVAWALAETPKETTGSASECLKCVRFSDEL